MSRGRGQTARQWAAALAALSLGAPPLAAQEQATGAGAFVRLGASARAIGMGRAYTAVSGEDAMGVFWNPAAAVGSSRRIAVTNRFFGDRDLGMDGAMSFVSIGGSTPMWGNSAIGAGVMRFGVDRIEQYDERARYLGEFSDEELLAVVAVARRQGPISVGLSAKMLRQAFTNLDTQGPTSDSGFGFDAGLIAHFWRAVRIGVSLRDNVDLGVDRAAETALVGIAYDRPVRARGPSSRLLVALDVEQVRDRPIRLHWGIALDNVTVPQGILIDLRFGQSNRMLEGRLSRLLTSDLREIVETEDLVGENIQWGFGFGIRKGAVRLDYAFSLGQLHDPQYLSMGYYY